MKFISTFNYGAYIEKVAASIDDHKFSVGPFNATADQAIKSKKKKKNNTN